MVGSSRIRVLVVGLDADLVRQVDRQLPGDVYRVSHVAAQPHTSDLAALPEYDVLLIDGTLGGFDRGNLPRPVVIVTNRCDDPAALAPRSRTPADCIQRADIQQPGLLAAVVDRAFYEQQIVQQSESALFALQQSEERYRTLVEQIPVIIYVTSFTEGSTTFYVSPYIERVLGFSQAEWSEGPNLWIRQLYPDDRRRVLEELGHSLDNRTPFTSEYRLIARDGRVLWFRDEAVIVRDSDGNPLHLHGVRLDITERKLAEEALERRLDELNLLNTASRAMVSSLDRETVMEAIMRQAVQVLRVEAASVLLLDAETGELVFEAASGGGAAGLRGRRLAPGTGVAGWVVQHRQSVVVADAYRDTRFERSLDARSGFTTRSILCVPLIARGQIIGVMQALNKIGGGFREGDRYLLEALASTAAIAIENAQLYDEAQRELRERVRAEQALKEERENLAQRVAERTAELSAANAELARAARLKDEFLASVSHELRTPLNAILGLSEALQEGVYGDLNEKQIRSLHSIEESGRHLLSLITDILDVSKIEAGKLELELGPVPVEMVCQASLGLIRQQAHKKRLRISSTIDSTVTVIHADQRRLKQILVNLLSNAVKFTPEGGEIGLDVTGDPDAEVVHFVVWDTGIGISHDVMPRLFQPFVQLDSRLSRQYTGTGLGLALVRRLAELHGGGVSLESQVGKGSQFTVSLPWRQPSAFAQQVKPGSPTLAEAAAAQPERQVGSFPLILLAEDNEVNITTIAGYLRARGYPVIVARNGLEAIERTREDVPDIILMDVQMPEMDGLAAMQRLRADENTAHIPIIALTALAMPGDRERALQAGASEYMSKPVSLRRLVQGIESLVQAGR